MVGGFSHKLPPCTLCLRGGPGVGVSALDSLSVLLCLNSLSLPRVQATSPTASDVLVYHGKVVQNVVLHFVRGQLPSAHALPPYRCPATLSAIQHAHHFMRSCPRCRGDEGPVMTPVGNCVGNS